MNASKIGFSVLAWHLAQWGFVFADNKWLTPTTAQMGFREMPRAEYLRRLSALAQEPVRTGRWEAEAGAKAVADWRPAGDFRLESPSDAVLCSRKSCPVFTRRHSGPSAKGTCEMALIAPDTASPTGLRPLR